MNTVWAGILAMLESMTNWAERHRHSPVIYMWAREATRGKSHPRDKVRALVDELHKRSRLAPDPSLTETIDPLDLLTSERALDADDACLLIATLALSLNIPCQFVAARYGQSWTCWLSCEFGHEQWEIVDPVGDKPAREPDETVLGPVPGQSRG